MTEIALRAAGPDDLEWVKWALYTAVAWDPERRLPPPEVTVDHPELARYHRGWGRPGDLGVVAERGGQVVGVALCRLFTDDDHGHGYVAPETPEVAVGVADGERGNGLGTKLMSALAEQARAAGLTRLSLSVDTGNPARRLYERLGYRQLSADDDGVRMVLDLLL